MRYSQEFIEKVQEASNLVDLISQYSQLKPVGGGYMGRCPFPDHPEKTPSFSVSEAKQVFHCFGCHKKGNIFSFLSLYNGLSFRESLEYLAERANIALPVADEGSQDQHEKLIQKKRELLKINSLTAQLFGDQFAGLGGSHPAKTYLKERGLNAETISSFQIGYANEAWDSLVSHLTSKGASLERAEELRLIRPRKEGKTGFYDLFRERIMFPIKSITGEVVGFGGRIIDRGEPKYLNSTESLVFNKGKILYGLDLTARHIRSEDLVIIVEGYMDLISLYQHGILNVAATMGTALTPDHARQISKMTKNVVVLFDGDEAGRTAAERSLPILLAGGLLPRGLILENNQDPDDYIRANGKAQLLEKIIKSSDLYSLILNEWTKDYRGEASEKLTLCDKLSPIFEQIPDSRLRQLYGIETAQKLHVDAKWLAQALKRPPTSGAPHQRAVGVEFASQNEVRPVNSAIAKSGATGIEDLSEEKIQLKGIGKPERMMLELILRKSSLFEKFVSSGVESLISHSGFKQIYQRTLAQYRQQPEKFDRLTGLLSVIVDHPEWIIGDSLSKVNLDSSGDEAAENKLFQDCVFRIKEQDLKIRAEKLAIEIKENPSSEKWEEFTSLQRERMTLMKEQV